MRQNDPNWTMQKVFGNKYITCTVLKLKVPTLL